MRDSIRFLRDPLNMRNFVGRRLHPFSELLRDGVGDDNLNVLDWNGIGLDPLSVLDGHVLDGGDWIGLLWDPLHPLHVVGLGLKPLSVGHWVGGVLVELAHGDWQRLWLHPFEGLVLHGVGLYPDGVGDGIWRVLEPLSGADRVGLGLDPLNVLLGEGFLWDVLGPWHGEGSLLDVLDPRVSDGLLWDVFEISVFDGRRLEDLNVLDGVGGRHDGLDSLVGSVVNLIPAVIDDGGEVIEGVVVVEVGVADGWRSPRGLGNVAGLHDDDVVVRVGVHEIVVVQVSGGDGRANSCESGVLGEDGEVIVGVHVVEVLIGNPGIRMGDGCLDSSVDKDWVVVAGDVVKEVQV